MDRRVLEAAARPDNSNSISFRVSRQYIRDVAGVGLQIADALSYSHTHGVLHRDVKPSNVMLDESGTAWLADFGLASTGDESLTETGDVVGTLRYMGPERFRGECDERSDIYGLGMTLYELISGRPAFDACDRLQLVRDIAELQPQRLRTVNSAVPRDLETVVSRAIATEPAERYENAAQLADDLRAFVEGRPIASRRQTIFERVIRWGRRNPALSSLSVCLVMSLAVGAALFGWQYQQTREANTQLTRSNKSLTQARDEAELVADFMTRTLRSPVPGADGRQLKVVELFERAMSELAASTHLADSTRGAMYLALSEGLRGVGLWDESIAAAETATTLLPKDSDKRLKAQAWLGASYANNDRFVQSITLLESVVPVAEHRLGSTHDTTVVARTGLAAAYRGHHQFDRAIEMLEVLVADLTLEFGAGDQRTIDATNQLGTSYIKANRAAEATTISMEVVMVHKTSCSGGPAVTPSWIMAATSSTGSIGPLSVKIPSMTL